MLATNEKTVQNECMCRGISSQLMAIQIFIGKFCYKGVIARLSIIYDPGLSFLCVHVRKGVAINFRVVRSTLYGYTV